MTRYDVLANFVATAKMKTTALTLADHHLGLQPISQMVWTHGQGIQRFIR